MSIAFTPQERRILEVVQDQLPASLTPYADVARQCGVTEAAVLELLRRLKASGAIRRFGASIRHQRSGWNHNAMVAWAASPEEAAQYGPDAAQNSHISHAYFRPSYAPDWPYTLYTMVHGRSEEEVDSVVKALAASWPMRPYAVLRSVRELKKTSMTYFPRGMCHER